MAVVKTTLQTTAPHCRQLTSPNTCSHSLSTLPHNPHASFNTSPYFFYRRARQRCFWLLAFISRPQVRNIHLSGRMILLGSLIPSDKYFLKNLTFVVRISTRVATSPFQSNSLPFQSNSLHTLSFTPYQNFSLFSFIAKLVSE